MTAQGPLGRKRRLVGMFTAVIVGVAFLAGTLVLGDTVRASFGTLFTEANSGTDAVGAQRPPRSTADGETAQGAHPRRRMVVAGRSGRRCRRRPRRSVEGTAQLVGADGDRIGGNGTADARVELGDHRRRSTRGASSTAARPTAAGEVVIDRAVGRRPATSTSAAPPPCWCRSR